MAVLVGVSSRRSLLFTKNFSRIVSAGMGRMVFLKISVQVDWLN